MSEAFAQNQIKHFLSNSTVCDYNVIILTETWLNNSHFSAEFFCNQFNVYRKDRNDTGSQLQRCGGVLIAVNSISPSENIILENSGDIEYLCV